MDQQKLGVFIREVRKEKGMTQQELANRLNITDRAISKWENGRCLPDIAFLEPLSIILGVEISELVKGERIPKEDLGKVNAVVEGVVNSTISDSQKKRRNFNNWFGGGLVFYVLVVLENQFGILDYSSLNYDIQEFIKGLLVGMGFACFFAGYLTNNKYASKMKNFQKGLFKKK
ncbi:MAG: helix-turn-helix domain-containing protein [Oscillospiraceae bacterium]|nr:helix-turn-helix domain-containing protein [Oscillospiraceae bacterium]